MKYNNEWLMAKYRAGEKIKFVFFWGHQPSTDGSVTKSCFSQWAYTNFTVNGVSYKTAEHWMMAGKASMFNDNAILAKILGAATPAEVKKLGRQVKGFDAAVWDANKFSLVRDGNIHKFGQHPELKTFLLNTGDRVLVEASPLDRIWGIGLGEKNEHAENPLLWRGQNLLGYALMEARDQLNQNG